MICKDPNHKINALIASISFLFPSFCFQPSSYPLPSFPSFCPLQLSLRPLLSFSCPLLSSSSLPSIWHSNHSFSDIYPCFPPFSLLHRLSFSLSVPLRLPSFASNPESTFQPLLVRISLSSSRLSFWMISISPLFCEHVAILWSIGV